PQAMAPSSVRERGELTEDEYNRERLAFGRFVSTFMESLLERLTVAALAERSLLHFGIGAGDDLAYLPNAIRIGLLPELLDISAIARTHALTCLAALFRAHHVTGVRPEEIVRFGNIVTFFDEHPEYIQETLVIQASRVLQHLEDAELAHALRSMG